MYTSTARNQCTESMARECGVCLKRTRSSFGQAHKQLHRRMMHDDMTCYTRVDRACACCSLSYKDIEDIDNPLLLYIHTRHPVLLPGHAQGCCCSALGAPSCARHLCCNLYLSALACGEYVQVYVRFLYSTPPCRPYTRVACVHGCCLGACRGGAKLQSHQQRLGTGAAVRAVGQDW